MKKRNLLDREERDHPSKAIDGINLMARAGFVEDIAACWKLHRSLGLPYTEASLLALPDMWRALLSRGAMKLFLVEDRARPSSRVLSFGTVVFVTDQFCSEARSTLRPFLGVELTRRYISRGLPVLSRKHVAQANASDGLNVLMCFEGWAYNEISPRQLLVVREKQSEAFHIALSGYRLKEFVGNEIGDESTQWMLNAGARLRRDYSNWFRKRRKPEPSQRPWLVGLTKEEALAHPGSKIAGLFIHTAPRFHFTRSQRMLLQHALMGETCEVLARSLSLSPWTVKKRWHAIYDRVTDVDRELLPPSIAYGAYASSRGTERRRHLLNYLRQHLEELRPYEASMRWIARTPARKLRTNFVYSARSVSDYRKGGRDKSMAAAERQRR